MNKNMNKKKLLTFLVVGLLGLVVVNAALVSYWGQQTMTFDVTEAITMDSNECTFSAIAGGGYDLCLMSGSNNLDKVVSTDIEFVLSEWNGNSYVPVADTLGFYIGFTEDSVYSQNPSATWEEAKDWMIANPDWLDWIIDTPVENYDNTLVLIGETYEANFVNNGAFQQDIAESDDFYVAVYIGTDVALEAGDYQLTVEIAPVTA